MNGAKEIMSKDFPSMPVANHEQSGLKRKVYRDHTISTVSVEIGRGLPIREHGRRLICPAFRLCVYMDARGMAAVGCTGHQVPCGWVPRR